MDINFFFSGFFEANDNIKKQFEEFRKVKFYYSHDLFNGTRKFWEWRDLNKKARDEFDYDLIMLNKYSSLFSSGDELFIHFINNNKPSKKPYFYNEYKNELSD